MLYFLYSLMKYNKLRAYTTARVILYCIWENNEFLNKDQMWSESDHEKMSK